MTTSLTGTLDYAIIDGYRLKSGGVADQDVVFNPLTETNRMLPGGRARQATRYGGAGYPLRPGWWEVTLRYSHLGDDMDLVDEIFDAPGAHSVVLWKRRKRTYAGNGVRTTFYLPWVPAGLLWNLPGMIAAAADRLATEVKIGIGGTNNNGVTQTSTDFTVLVKSAVDYAGGSPASDEAWFIDTGTEFKVGTAPLAGDRLIVRYVPIWQMFNQGPQTEKNKPGSTLEPRDLVLVET